MLCEWMKASMDTITEYCTTVFAIVLLPKFRTVKHTTEQSIVHRTYSFYTRSLAVRAVHVDLIYPIIICCNCTDGLLL